MGPRCPPPLHTIFSHCSPPLEPSPRTQPLPAHRQLPSVVQQLLLPRGCARHSRTVTCRECLGCRSAVAAHQSWRPLIACGALRRGMSHPDRRPELHQRQRRMSLVVPFGSSPVSRHYAAWSNDCHRFALKLSASVRRHAVHGCL